MEVFPSWTSAALPDVWNNGEDLEYTYHGAQYNDATLCKIAPFVLNHLADRNAYWNETIMKSFVMALDYHLNTNIPSVGSYFLTPTILTIDEIYLEYTGKRQETGTNLAQYGHKANVQNRLNSTFEK